MLTAWGYRMPPAQAGPVIIPKIRAKMTISNTNAKWRRPKKKRGKEFPAVGA